MRGAMGTVGQSERDGDNLPVAVVSAEIGPQLFEVPQRRERRPCLHHRDQPHPGQTGGHAQLVLLRDTDVEGPLREAPQKFLVHRVNAHIANARVAGGVFAKQLAERTRRTAQRNLLDLTEQTHRFCRCGRIHTG